jgi:hypothetical protein
MGSFKAATYSVCATAKNTSEVNEMCEACIQLARLQAEVRDNLQKKDKDGFAWLTNHTKGKPMPFEFARKFGFKLPIFDIRPPMPTADGRILTTDEGVWVKEGFE